ncbi:MAG: hypothetical protein QM768_15185 [Agriterribacter sp.]
MTSGRITFSLSIIAERCIDADTLLFSSIVIPLFVIPTLEESASTAILETVSPAATHFYFRQPAGGLAVTVKVF